MNLIRIIINHLKCELPLWQVEVAYVTLMANKPSSLRILTNQKLFNRLSSLSHSNKYWQLSTSTHTSSIQSHCTPIYHIVTDVQGLDKCEAAFEKLMCASARFEQVIN